MSKGGWDQAAVDWANGIIASAAGKPRYYLGVDPGTDTGLAVWDSATRSYVDITSGTAVAMEQRVLQLIALYAPVKIRVVIEDTRKLRLPAHLRDNTKANFYDKGVGSVHRDMGRWEEFCQYHSLDFAMQPLSRHIKRKMKSADFRQMTGWEKRTNEHERDAACIVWNR